MSEPLGLCFCVEYWPAYMGSDKRIGLFAKHAMNTGNVDVVVFPPLRILSGHHESEEALARLNPHFAHATVDNEQPRVHYVKIPRVLKTLWKKNTTIAYLLTLFICSVRSIRIFSKLSSKIVVLAHPSYLCGALGMFQAKIWRRRLVLDYPDPWTELTLDTMGWSHRGLRPALLGGLESLIIKAADVVVCASGPIARLATTMRKIGSVSVIPNGVDPSMFDPEKYNLKRPDASAERRVVFIGRIEKWSGTESLLSAAEISIRTRPDIKFVLVGDGLERNEIERLVRRKGLDGNISLVGFKAPEEIPRILAASDVAVLTIGKSSLANAISPLKLFEYMAMGRPLVVSDTESVREIVKDGQNGILVDGENSGEVASAILKLIDNPTFASEMGLRARKSILPSHDWTNLAERFVEICQKTAE